MKKLFRMKTLKNSILLLILSAVALVAVLPFVSVFINSFVDPSTVNPSKGSMTKIIFLPFPISIKQYTTVLLYTRETLYFFWNTVILTLPILAGGILFSVLSGYALAKFQFPFKKFLFYCYVLVMLLPIQINIVGTYLFFDKLHLVGRYIGVILPGMFSPFGAFLIYQFMKGVPDNTMESARLEGANEIIVLAKIVVPQVKPGIASMLILMLIDCWNMVEVPMTILKEESLYPLSVMLRYISASDPAAVYASTIVFSIPLLLVFFMAQDKLTEGIGRSGQIRFSGIKE